MVKLSHSAANKYADCPEAYRIHYVENIRPKTYHAALSFGSAVEAGINVLLTSGNMAKAREVFLDAWSVAEINGEKESLRESLKVVYSDKDFDTDLVDMPDEVAVLYKEIKDKKKTVGYDNLSDEDKRLFNALNWDSSAAKGALMLEAFERQVLPNIEKVYHMQKRVDFKNEDGDEVVGYVDLICKWRDIGDVVIDIKTSATEYETDSVRTSQQLILYTSALGLQWAGYVVMLKGMKKDRVKICQKCKHDGSASRAKTCDNEVKGSRCKGEWDEKVTVKADVQIVMDKISEYAKDMVMENFMQLVHAIKQESFPKALSKCQNMYGKPCPFIKKCWTGDMEGLIKLDKKGSK